MAEYEFTLAPEDMAALGVGDRERLGIEMAQVTIQESVEIQRRTGLTPRGLLEALDMRDAFGLLAGVWLALRQAGVGRGWHEIEFRVYPDAGKGSSSGEPEESTSD